MNLAPLPEHLPSEPQLDTKQAKFSFAYFSVSSPTYNDLPASCEISQYPLEKIQSDFDAQAPWLLSAKNTYWKSNRITLLREKFDELISRPLEFENPAVLRIQADTIMKGLQAFDPNFKVLKDSTPQPQKSVINIVNYSHGADNATVQVHAQTVPDTAA